MKLNFHTMGDPTLVTLAEQLWHFRRNGGAINIPTDGGPADVDAALEIQREAVALSGLDAVGFKVGSTSAEAQKILGTTEPGASPVLVDYFFESPAEIPIDPAHEPAVEGEFALRLARDLPPRDEEYSFDDVRDAVEVVAGAIEVVGSRFAGGLAGKGRLLTTADFGANIALAVGPWTTDWKGFDLAAHEVHVSLDGMVRESGIGARALGHPLNVLQWLANKQSQTGRGLLAGEIISTGTCTGLLDVAPGDSVAADFGTLGAVEISFTELSFRAD